VVVGLVAVGVSACGPGIVRNPAPAELAEMVQPLGVAGLREWGDALTPEEVTAVATQRGPAIRALYGDDIKAGRTPKADFLALSGGGQWGAFAAGILNAWSGSGERPEFLGVSGVSTGAIIAPFAFLGPDYDATLREIYTAYSTTDLVEPRLLSGLISGTALSDTTLLAGVIAKYVTAELLEKIAAEYRAGRLLYIGTTNLDAGRPVIWNITAIAASGEPGALDLVRDLIRASAAIPVAFPPIFVKVETPDGQVFDEMHVDGGASSQVTFVSPEIPIAAMTREILGRNIDRKLWVIVNNDLAPARRQVRPRVASIGEAAVSSLIRGSGIGDVYRLYAIAQRDEVDFNVTWIPNETPCPPPQEDFDRAFMSCLYEYGGDLLRSGGLWRSGPPFFALPADPGSSS
jgi:predicted acylesterase/phospholipase RssA